MNCDMPALPPNADEGSHMPTSPFCDEARADNEAVASKNMPSGFRSPTKRDDSGVTGFGCGGVIDALPLGTW